MTLTLVHVGQHKTGTTSIQSYLANEQDRLARRGLYVPRRGRLHAELTVYGLDRDRWSPFKEDHYGGQGAVARRFFEWTLRRRVAREYRLARRRGCATVLWSNEGLSLLNSTTEYDRVVRLLARHGDRVVAVCCFRDRREMRASYIAELEREGRPASTDRDSFRYVEEDSWVFDQERKRRLLEESFDEVLAFPYDAGDNVGRFLAVIGYPVDDVPADRLNETRAQPPGEPPADPH